MRDLRDGCTLVGGGADDEDEDKDGDDTDGELPPANGAGDRWTVCSVDAIGRGRRSLMRFGMGMIGRSIGLVVMLTLKCGDGGLLLEERGESSRAAWPLVRFTFAATDGHWPLAQL